MIEDTVYILCALTSFWCAVLLVRAYRSRRRPLLLWSCLCFVGLALNNSLLVADKIIFPDVYLAVWRIVPAFLGIVVLVYGLVRNMSS